MQRTGSAFIILSFLFMPYLARAANTDIVITEIGAFEASDHEWVEIYNRGASAVDITGWKFFEEGVNHGLTAYRGDLIIDPGEYAIIADVASNFEIDRSLFQGTIIDSSWSILKESGESIALKDGSGTIVESFAYIPAPDGSLERIDFNNPDYSASNWQENKNGGTPGFPNAASGNSAGSSEASSGGGAPEAPTQTSESDSQTATPPAPAVPPYGAGSVVINEFMPDPGEDAAEWIEILSKAEVSLDLAGWILEDGLGKIADISGEFFPGQYRFMELKSIRLNNAGDMIKLIDPRGALIDQVTYGNFDDGKVSDNAPKVSYPNSLARFPGGIDTDEDSKNFNITKTPTPGAQNNITVNQDFEEIIEDDDAQNIETVASQTNDTAQNALTNSGASIALRGESPDAEEVAGPSAPQSTKNLRSGTVAVSGTVTVLPGIFGSRIFYIQNENNAYEIYMHKASFPDLAVGDTIQVTGARSEVLDGRRIKIAATTDIIVIGHGSVPEPDVVATRDIDTDMLARLVQISGEILEVKGSNKFIVADDDAEILVEIKRGTGIGALHLGEGDPITVTGIVYSSSDSFRILPRAADDIDTDSTEAVASASPVASLYSPTKQTMLAIMMGLLGASGAAGIFIGIRYKDKIFSWRRKSEVIQETIEID